MSNVLITPVWNPKRGFHSWNILELYGQSANGVNVPNVDDIVYDIAGKKMFRVVSVDQDGRSQLTSWSPRDQEDLDQSNDGFIGGGPYPIENSFRAYIDYSVTPASLTVDSRVRTYSTRAQYVKIFVGATDVNSDTDVVSMYYSNSLDTADNKIPLVGLQVDGGVSNAIKVPDVGYCNRQLEDGTELTMVSYDSSDEIVKTTRLVVRRTENVRRVNSAAKYITGIRLHSPFLSRTRENVLQIPVNTELNATNLVAVIEYNDGDTVELTVGSGRVRFHGLDGWISSTPGERVDALLSYQLGDNEYVVDGVLAEAGLLTKRYYIESSRGNASGEELIDSYGVKLFAFPTWNQANNRYDLRYWLHTLNRDQVYDVTPYIEYSDAYTFDGQAIGVRQRFVVNIDLNRVAPSFNAYRHVQIIDITLNRAGFTRSYPLWTIGFTNYQSPRYGTRATFLAERVSYQPTEIQSTAQGPVEVPVGDPYLVWRGVINSGAGSVSDWLSRLMYAAKPLYDVHRELNAPVPTHVRLYSGHVQLREIPLNTNEWSEEMQFAEPMVFSQAIRLVFIKREAIDGSEPVGDPIAVYDDTSQLVGYIEMPDESANTVDYVVGLGALQLIDLNQNS